MNPNVLTCNTKHSGCFHSTPVSSFAITPCCRDLQTTFPGQRRSAECCWSVGTHSESVSLSVGSSHHSQITSPAVVTGGPETLYLEDTHTGLHTYTGYVYDYDYVCRAFIIFIIFLIYDYIFSVLNVKKRFKKITQFLRTQVDVFKLL